MLITGVSLLALGRETLFVLNVWLEAEICTVGGLLPLNAVGMSTHADKLPQP